MQVMDDNAATLIGDPEFEFYSKHIMLAAVSSLPQQLSSFDQIWPIRAMF